MYTEKKSSIQKNTAHYSVAVVFIYAIATLLRLWLTANNDIIATNGPYDEYWYIDSASRNIFGGNYNNMSFAHLPIYSAWLWALNGLGIPARLGIDALWVFSSLYLALVLTKLTKSHCAGIATYVILIFNPYSIHLFNLALAETLLVALSALLIATAIDAWHHRTASCRRKNIATGIFGIIFALSFFTREEGIVLFAPIIIFALCSLLYRPFWWKGKLLDKNGVRFIVTPLVSTLVLGTVLAGANYIRWDKFVSNELAAPGYRSAIKALNSIDTGPTPRYATVTAKARYLAYQVSPTFKELSPFFEGASGQAITSSPVASVQGEIGNGWFYWALRDAAATAGWYTNPNHVDEKYSAIANEINKAFTNGTLKKRPYVFSTFIDPDIGKWLKEVPASTMSMISLMAFPVTYSIEGTHESATPRQFEAFVAITARRNLQKAYSLTGWISTPLGARAAIGGESTPVTWESIEDRRRIDLGPETYALSVKYAGDSPPSYLYVMTKEGKISRASLLDLKEGAIAYLSGEVPIVVGIDEITGVRKDSVRDIALSAFRDTRHQVSMMNELFAWTGYLFITFIVLGVLLSIAAGLIRTPIFLVFLAALATVSARSLALGILDASSWAGLQVRYVFPGTPFFVCAGILGLALTVMSIKKLLGKGARITAI